MPRWITTVFSTCVLYLHSNVSNRGIVLRVLHDNINDLLGSGSTLNLTPQERLARVHALMLYQVIRMFDGDITLGAQADNNMAILDSWLEDLIKIRDNLVRESKAEEPEIRSQPPESWEVSDKASNKLKPTYRTV